MAESRVSSRYAKSLIDLSIERNVLDAVNQDIILFLDACEQTPELVKLFRNPVVKGDKKLMIIQKIFNGKINSLTMLFLETVIKKNREFYMVDIAGEFRKAYNLFKGIASASVTTAITIDDQLKQEIRAHVAQQTQKQIELSSKVDPNIIGGLVIQLEDKLFDASISGKLAAIKKNLINSHLTK